jgi:hypothetical protein
MIKKKRNNTGCRCGCCNKKAGKSMIISEGKWYCGECARKSDFEAIKIMGDVVKQLEGFLNGKTQKT